MKTEKDYEYDIGLVYRSNHNYGANMTHYALYSILVQWGYCVAMIDLPEDSPYYLPVTRFDPYELYMNIPYDEDSIRFIFKHKWDLLQMNQKCRMFLVGSDQLWRNYFVKGTDYYSTLDWVLLEKFKMSYSTSFGMGEFEGDDEDEQALAQRLARLNEISVREQSGIQIIRKMLHREAVCVADPVFLCPKEKYDALAENGMERLPKEKFIAAYILDRTDAKDRLIQRIGKEFKNCNYVLIEDAMATHEYSNNDEMNPLQDAKNEEWLAMIKKCEVLVTDSFHGTCFAIIFRKPFFTISSKDNYRGYSRMKSLLSIVGLENRMIDNCECQYDSAWITRKINYSEVYDKLEKYVYQSKKWLSDNIQKGMGQYCKAIAGDNTYIEALLKASRDYYQKINNIKAAIEPYFHLGDKVMVWGTGGCFLKNIKRVTEIFEVVSIVDSDSTKWGKSYLGDIVCISPEEMMHSRDCEKIIILTEKPNVVEEIISTIKKNNRFTFIIYEELFGVFGDKGIHEKK